MTALHAGGPGRALLIDPTFGVAGDMLLAALVDAGAEAGLVRRCVEAVLPGAVALTFTEASRRGLRGTSVQVASVIEDHPHRPWAAIRERIRGAEIPEGVRMRALAVFGALAEAEAAVHGVSAEVVEFHEVGAWDSVADVVGVAAALESLGVQEVLTLPLSVGNGTVRAAHGVMAVPPPAVAQLLGSSALVWQGLPPGAGADLHGGGALVGELATPTGVAVLAALARPVVAAPAAITLAQGVGVGTKDFPAWPNAVRVQVLGAPQVSGVPGAGLEERALTVCEVTLDDLDPRAWPSVHAETLAAGALDVWSVDALGKKGRPARILSVLLDPQEVGLGDMVERIARHTGTLGVRTHQVQRYSLAREWREVALPAWPGASVRVKFGVLQGRVVHATPEYEDCAAVAARHEVPVAHVLEAARAGAERAGIVPGASTSGNTTDCT